MILTIISGFQIRNVAQTTQADKRGLFLCNRDALGLDGVIEMSLVRFSATVSDREITAIKCQFLEEHTEKLRLLQLGPELAV